MINRGSKQEKYFEMVPPLLLDPALGPRFEHFGFQPSSGPIAGWNETRPWVDERFGRIVRVPTGMNAGFQDNVGIVIALVGST